MSGAEEGPRMRSRWRFYGSCLTRIGRDK